MKRIGQRTVELLPGEVIIVDAFHDRLSDGGGIADTALAVLPRFGRREWHQPPAWISTAFVEYLSDGTLTITESHGRRVYTFDHTTKGGTS